MSQLHSPLLSDCPTNAKIHIISNNLQQCNTNDNNANTIADDRVLLLVSKLRKYYIGNTNIISYLDFIIFIRVYISENHPVCVWMWNVCHIELRWSQYDNIANILISHHPRTASIIITQYSQHTHAEPVQEFIKYVSIGIIDQMELWKLYQCASIIMILSPTINAHSALIMNLNDSLIWKIFRTCDWDNLNLMNILN